MEKPHFETAPASAAGRQLRDEFFVTGDAGRVLHGRSQLAESVVRSAYARLLAPACREGVGLAAVGGFGRGELFPYSDVDLLLVVDDTELGVATSEALSAFLRTLWDAGLRLSHSVRTPRECCQFHEENIELSISLLDRRFLAGDRELYGKLESRLPGFLHSRRHDLIRHLCRLARSRHARFQNTIYHLEPNIKEAPGGLRDVHLLWWLGKLRGELAAPQWHAGIEPAHRFLSALRCYLHFRAGRDDNLLSFDAQEEITAQDFFPYKEPEAWLREYFLHARQVHRMATRELEASEGQMSSLLREFRNWRSRLSNVEFTVSRERVYFRSPHRLAVDPGLALRLFEFAGRHNFRLAVESERRLADALPTLERYFSQPRELWPALGEILSTPNASSALRAMHETGVLRAMFPEWARVECLVIRDFYHRYTVDEHTLLAIESLELLRDHQDPVHRRFAELLAGVEQPALLRFALLFHDAGKGLGEATHVPASLRLAELGMERIRMPVPERRTVRFLIERHLDLAAAMSTRDPNDPSAARFLADRAETLEGLRSLTLLTYADISAIHPSAMSPWRLELLWRVYLAAYHELTRELDTLRIREAGADSAAKTAFLEGFPTRYLRTHSEQDIETHLEMSQRARRCGVALEISKGSGVYRLTLLAKDRPFLLASIAGALASFGLNILKAESFINRLGVVLETFVFEDPTRTLELNPPEVERLRVLLERATLGKLQMKSLLEARMKAYVSGRRARIQPRVSFNNQASDLSTLFEAVAEDRPGLLFDLASVLSEGGCNIEVVLIEAEAQRALAVFYVTAGGEKLTEARAEILRERLLKAAQP